MKKLLSCRSLILSFAFCSLSVHAFSAGRYWVHKPFYENSFSTAAELAQWNIVEDNGTGSWSLTGNGTSLLKMDNAAGGYANRMFNINGAAANLLPLDRVNGRVEIMVKAITGGNQRIFVQVQQFNASNTYISEFSILPSQSATGFFTINLSGFSWDPAADKVRFMIGGENFSGQQGTVEFDYFSYSNSNGDWNNTANWSALSGGAGGASVPGVSDVAIFDGAAGNNGSAVLNAAVTIAGLQISSGYSGNFDLQGNQLTIGSNGVNIAGGGVTGNGAIIHINGDVAMSGGAYKNIYGYNYVTGNMNFTGGVLDFSTGNVIFDASGDQQFFSTLTDPIHKIIINKPSGIITFNSDILVADSLLLTQGLLNSNGNIIRLGLSASNTGTLITGSGRINGSMKRWIPASATGNTDFPMGTATTNALLTLTVNSVPTTGGSIIVTYNDATPAFNPVVFTDGPNYTVLNRSAASWNILTSAVTGGSYSLSASNNHLASFSNLSDLHLSLATGVAGTHQPTTGSLSNPVLHRNGLAVADLSQSWFASLASATRRKIAVLGSSTAAGVGTASPDSAWVNRLNYYYKNQLAAIDTTYNLAVAGTTSYTAMPTTYIAPGGRPSPDPLHNVSQAVNLLADLPIPGNGVILVNFPTNGYDTYSTSEIMSSLQMIYDSATARGNICYICTTQPRTDATFGTAAVKRKIADLKDSINARFGPTHSIDFWNGMFNPADTSILAAYSAGDNTHFNNTGHRALLNRVLAKNIFGLSYVATAGDYRSNVSPTGLWSDPTSWQTYNGSAWVAASAAPSYTDGVVTIVNGDSIRINSAATFDQVIVENGAVLTMFNTSSSTTFTLNDGAGNDIENNGHLYISVNGVLNGNGNIQNNATGLFTLRNFGTLQVNTENLGAMSISGTGTIQNAVFLNDSLLTLVNFTLNLNNATLINSDSISMASNADNWFAGTGTSYLINNPGAIIYKPTVTGIANMNGTLAFTNSGSVKGIGQYNITTTSANTGLITAGNIIGLLTVNPALINGKSPTLAFNLRTTGAVPGINDDQLLLSAATNTNLTGASLIVTDNASDPVGTVYTIISSALGTITGPFANISLSPSLGNLVYNSNSVTVKKTSSLLPLDWGVFTAVQQGRQVVLHWTTLQEANTSRFIIERSANGIVYTSIGQVPAGAAALNYYFADADPLRDGTNYYRIRQVDNDGRFSWSVARTVKFKNQPVASVFSNSSTNELIITGALSGMSIRITDMNGRIIASRILSSGTNLINSSNWSAGIYEVSIFEKGILSETVAVFKAGK